MAKFKIPIQNSQFDPFSYEKQIEKFTGESKELVATPISSQDSSLNVLSNVQSEEGYSLLTNDAEALETINETKARNQGSLELAGKMLYNIGNTVLFETAKLPGYLMGALAGIAEGVIDGKNPINAIVDNGWVNALESMQEESKQLLPVHIQKDVQEGNLLDKATSGQWWATTGADGIGFLLSMMLPGQALKTLGIGSKIGTAAEFLGNNSKYIGKLFSKTGILEDIGKTGQFALKTGAPRAIDSFAAATLNTFAESAAEAANTFDNVKSKLIQSGLSEEEASIQAGESAAGVFKSNMALLIGSNLLDEAWLWKGFSNVQKGASNKILDKIFTKGADGKRKIDIEELKNIKSKGWKDALSLGSKNFLRQAAKEGFFEEGLQTSLQQSIEKDGASNSTVENLYGAASTYFTDFLSNKELHESIFLGGVLGGGMSVFQTANEIKNYNRQLNGTPAYNSKGFFNKLLGRRDRKEQQGLKGLFSENYINNFNSILDIAKKDENGKPIFKDGKVVVDEVKYAELAEQQANLIDANIKYDVAVAEGDKFTQDSLSDILTFNYLKPFLQQEGGYEVFKEHIPQLEESWAQRYSQTVGKEATPEQRKQFTENLTKKSEEFNTLYKEIESTHLPERFVGDIGTDDYQDWKSTLFNDKLNLGIQNRTLLRLEKQIEEEERNLSTKLLSNEESEEKPVDPFIAIQLKLLKETKTKIKNKLPELQQEYLSLFNKDGVQKHYNDFINKREEFKKNAEEAIKEEAVNAKENESNVNTINNIKSDALTKGYSEEEVIILQNPENKRYSLVTENEETFIYNEKGEKKKATQKLLEKLNLTIVSKEDLVKEKSAKDILDSRTAKLEIINDIVEYRESLYSKTKEEIKEINNEIEDAEKRLKGFKEELDNIQKAKRPSKKAIKSLEKNIKDVDTIISELVKRREHLENLKIRYEALLDEYKIYQSYLNQTNINFSELKEIISNELFNAIKNDSQNISSDIVETEKAIRNLEETITSLNTTINNLLKLKSTIEQHLNAGTAFNALNIIILTKKEELLNSTKEIFSYSDSDFIDELSNEIKNNGLKNIMTEPRFKNKMLKRAEEVANNIPDYVARKYFGKDKITKRDVYNYFADKFKGLNNNIEELNIEITERDVLRNRIFETQSEISKLSEELTTTIDNLNLQKLNKQYLVLEEINQEKVEAKYSEQLSKLQGTENNHIQKEYSVEPSDNPERISKEFSERQLGLNMYPVGGLNILYEASGKNKGYDVLNESGLPVQNTSPYQQLWYKTIDKIVRDPKDDITKYNILLYKPDYATDTLLERQIGENNPNNRSDSDLFAVLTDEDGSPVIINDSYVFTSIWRPEVLYNENPRLAPDAFVQPLLNKIGVSNVSYKEITPTSFRKNEVSKIKKYLNLGNEQELTKEVIFNAALERARNEYTIWYDKVISENNKKNNVYVKPKGVTSGRPLQRRDENRKIVWSSITKNLPFIKVKSGTGTDKLVGGKLIMTPRSGKLTLGKGVIINSYPGDIVLVPNGELNIIPTKSRNINDEEANLILYLLSLNKESIPLPKGVSYKIGTAEIKDNVNLFFYQTNNKALNAQLKNFSLLNSLINYGKKEKQEGESVEEFNKRNKGSIYVATKTKKVIYTDFDGKVHIVPISVINEAFEKNDFTNDKVMGLLDFLKQKRFNVSQSLLEQNIKFPYPSLVKKVNTAGKVEYSIKFDNSKSYYEFLINGENPILSTSVVSDPNYPLFVQRNLYFEPSFTTEDSVKETKQNQKDEKEMNKTFVERLKKAQQSLVSQSDEEIFNALAGLKPELKNNNMFSKLKPVGTSSLEIPENNDNLVLPSETSSLPKSNINSLEDIPDEDIGEIYADKLYSPNELLTIKLKNGQIKQNCK